LRNNGDMWALNSVIAVGLIAIFLIGFFMVASLVLPKDVGKIKASVADADSGSQLISLFRVPVRNMVVADIVRGSVSCSEFENVLDKVHTYSAYSLKINGKTSCSKGLIKDNVLKVDFALPLYDDRIADVSLEVSK